MVPTGDRAETHCPSIKCDCTRHAAVAHGLLPDPVRLTDTSSAPLGRPRRARKAGIEHLEENIGADPKTFSAKEARQVRISDFGRFALNTCVVAAMLAGCGGSQPPIAASGQGSQSHASAGHVDRAGSWMLPEAKNEDLVYVAGYGAGAVFVFAYPSGKPVGELTDIPEPIYECSDKSGNIFIASQDIYNGGIYEYAHAGTQPINFLPLNEAQGCSIDPVTGNLAAVTFSDAVYVYQNAQGTPTKYVDSDLYFAQDVAYDDTGSLFVDGAYHNFSFALVELLNGTSTFQDITVNPYGDYDDDTYSPILWDGKYLDLGSVGVTRGLIYRLKISGNSAAVAGRVKLARQRGVGPYAQFWVQAARIVQPSSERHSSFAIFKYPRGKQILQVKLHQDYFTVGVTISAAASRSRVRKRAP